MVMKRYKISYTVSTYHLGKRVRLPSPMKPIISAQNPQSAINKLIRKYRYVKKSDIISVKKV